MLALHLAFIFLLCCSVYAVYVLSKNILNDVHGKLHSFPQVFVNKCKDEYTKRLVMVNYPVPIILGTKNENGFSKNKIETEFYQLKNLFEIFYFKTLIPVTNKFVNNYVFSVNGLKKDLTNEEIEALIQTISERVVSEYLILIGNPPVDISDLISINFLREQKELEVFVAENPYGASWIVEYKRKKKLDSLSLHDKSHVKADEYSMIWGYDLNELPNKIPLRYSIVSHPHALITGATGTGKTNTLLFLINNYLKLYAGSLWLCDFKNGEDFRFLEGTDRYYTFENCYDGIKKFYSEFVSDRKTGVIRRRQLLIIDEYNSLIGYLSTKDKENKTKYAQEVQSMIGEILAMGRSLGYMVWISVQRPDSSIFATGSRDNFLVTLALGNPSKEHFNMMFAGETKFEQIFSTGEGVLKADGYPLEKVKYPRINKEKVQKQIKDSIDFYDL